jgi:hypothetical protein
MYYALEVSRQIERRVPAALLIVVMLLISVASSASAAAISQGYQADTQLAPGTLVVQDNTSNKIVPADTSNNDQLLGVVVGANTTTLSVSNSSDDIQVATSGTGTLFVTDLNGAIKAGDLITSSPIRGVGMKATAAGRVVGVAQADAPTAGESSVSVTTVSGKHVTAHVSTVPVTIQVSSYSPPPPKSSTPQFLQAFANSIAGKPVAIVRLVISAIILMSTLCLVGIMVFSGVRGSMNALGRNPLAKHSIYQGLWQVLVTSIVMMAVALAGSYVVLTR